MLHFYILVHEIKMLFISQLLPRERQTLDYSQKLKDRYKYTPEIRRILKHRHLPAAIYKTKKVLKISSSSQKRKLENVRKHSKPGSIPKKLESTKHIVNQEE
jgi:WD repeat and SOF domain-containing protein 1